MGLGEFVPTHLLPPGITKDLTLNIKSHYKPAQVKILKSQSSRHFIL